MIPTNSADIGTAALIADEVMAGGEVHAPRTAVGEARARVDRIVCVGSRRPIYIAFKMLSFLGISNSWSVNTANKHTK
jgi:hypothetical protein